MSLTSDLGHFVSGLSFDRLPADVIDIAKTGLALEQFSGDQHALDLAGAATDLGVAE